MGRRDDERAGADEVVEERLGERGALRRVRARAELVEEDERPGAGQPDDPDDRPQVAAERREGLRHRLLVADVGEDVAEDRERAAGGGGDVEPRLVHEREQPDGPQRDRLAAGVRARDDERRVVAAEPDVDRARPTR